MEQERLGISSGGKRLLGGDGAVGQSKRESEVEGVGGEVKV